MRRIYLPIILSILSLTGYCQHFQTTLNFESPSPYLVDSLTTGQWQVGIPAKPFFDTAYSLPRALMTDTVNSYAPSTRSEVYFLFDSADHAWSTDMWMWFDHKYQSTSGLDGGWIEMKFSDTGCWFNILDPTYLGFTWLDSCLGGVYSTWGAGMDFIHTAPAIDTLADGTYAFSSTQDWEVVGLTINWAQLVRVQEDFNIWVRFIFESDASPESLDGWMIDNFTIWFLASGGVEEQASSSISLYPNPVKDRLQTSVSGQASQLRILDYAGRVLDTREYSEELDVSALPEGIYLLQVVLENGQLAHERFIVER